MFDSEIRFESSITKTKVVCHHQTLLLFKKHIKTNSKHCYFKLNFKLKTYQKTSTFYKLEKINKTRKEFRNNIVSHQWRSVVFWSRGS